MPIRSVAADYPSRDPQIFYDRVRDLLAMQQDTITALDEKIGQLFMLATALLAVLAAVFAFERSFDWGQIVIGVAAIVAFVYVAQKSFEAYRERDWHFGPELPRLWEDMWSEADDVLMKWAIANTSWEAYTLNAKEVKKKSDALPRLFWGVLIQTGLVVVALFLVAVEA